MPNMLAPEQSFCVVAPNDQCEEFNSAHTLSLDAMTLTGQESLAGGSLTLSNGGGFFTGGLNARFLHFPNVNGSFFVHTIVRPRGDQGAWPGPEFQLGGLVVRDSTCTSSNCARWIKAEAGTLDAEGMDAPTRRGIRVAEHDSDLVSDLPVEIQDAYEPGWLDYCDRTNRLPTSPSPTH